MSTTAPPSNSDPVPAPRPDFHVYVSAAATVATGKTTRSLPAFFAPERPLRVTRSSPPFNNAQLSDKDAEKVIEAWNDVRLTEYDGCGSPAVKERVGKLLARFPDAISALGFTDACRERFDTAWADRRMDTLVAAAREKGFDAWADALVAAMTRMCEGSKNPEHTASAQAWDDFLTSKDGVALPKDISQLTLYENASRVLVDPDTGDALMSASDIAALLGTKHKTGKTYANVYWKWFMFGIKPFGLKGSMADVANVAFLLTEDGSNTEVKRDEASTLHALDVVESLIAREGTAEQTSIARRNLPDGCVVDCEPDDMWALLLVQMVAAAVWTDADVPRCLVVSLMLPPDGPHKTSRTETRELSFERLGQHLALLVTAMSSRTAPVRSVTCSRDQTQRNARALYGAYPDFFREASVEKKSKAEEEE